MEELKRIVDKMSYVGMINKWDDSHFNEYVITGIQAGPSNINRRVGRIVQVRLKEGAFGTALVFLRHPDGGLTTHENQSFVPLKGEDRKIVEQMFKDNNVCQDDPFNHEYTIAGKYPAKGFIILDGESKKIKREEKLKDLTGDN